MVLKIGTAFRAQGLASNKVRLGARCVPLVLGADMVAGMIETAIFATMATPASVSG